MSAAHKHGLDCVYSLTAGWRCPPTVTSPGYECAHNYESADPPEPRRQGCLREDGACRWRPASSSAWDQSVEVCDGCGGRRPPAAESGTPAPGEVGREALSLLYDHARVGLNALPTKRERLETVPELDAARDTLASLLSASPASETPSWTVEQERTALRDVHATYESGDLADRMAGASAAILALRDAASETHGPACNDGLRYGDGPAYQCHGECETPGPGEGDLRGVVDEAIRQKRRAIVAEQKVARVEAAAAEMLAAWDHSADADGMAADVRLDRAADALRAALADPEADRGGTT